MQCITSPNSCIRAKNHQLIPIEEFTSQFFNDHLTLLKSSSTTSTRINSIESFLQNSKEIVDTFREENERIGSAIIDIFESFIEKIKKLFVKFNQEHIKYIQQKDLALTNSIDNLLEMTKFDYLEGFNESLLSRKMKKMNFTDLNATILSMKESITNMQSDMTVRDLETVREVTSLKGDKVLGYFEREFKNLSDEAVKRMNLYTAKIREQMNSGESLDKMKFSEYKVIYDDTIDFTANSNFQTKKFTIFEHSNGNTLLAYPTSQNTIKIEYVDKFISEKTPTINPKTNPYVTQKANARDKYLYFTLQSHSGRINDIIYYRNKENQDFLITSSEDCSIKIWNITNINHFLTNVNQFYHSNCIKTLLGHQGIIIACLTFYDPLKNLNYIISMGYMDKIKVWNLITGQLIRDINDPNVNRGAHDNLMQIANVNKKNVLFTGNSTKRLIKIWDFDKGEVIRVINYENNNKIIKLEYYGDLNRIYIIDESGPSAYLDCRVDVNKMKMISAKLSNEGNDRRVGTFRWNSECIGVFCSNGFVLQYDIQTGECIDRVQMARSGISHAVGYMHHTKRKIIVVHSSDFHLKIFN